ncbi:MAG: class I SAM-dependent methyltransferase [Desulfomonilaceae bacterium]
MFRGAKGLKMTSPCDGDFSLNAGMIKLILDYAKPFGHNEQPSNLNLGFGFLYYGVARALRPQHVLVIGSGYGFSVVCLGLALKDNKVGQLTFVDPSYSLVKDGPWKTIGGRGTWSNPEDVVKRFEAFGIADIVTHYRLRSDEFFACYEPEGLPPIDLAFIDGSHTYKDVAHDFSQALKRAHQNSYVFLHDTNIYFRELVHNSGVKRWLRVLRASDKAFEVINFPYSSGVALVRIKDPGGFTCT